MKHILVFISLFMLACSFEPLRQFDTDDEESLSCLQSHGGMHGYCVKGQTL